MTRGYLFTTGDDNPTLIFVDQIVAVIKNGEGSLVKTSDGGQWNFSAVPYEEMVRRVTATE